MPEPRRRVSCGQGSGVPGGFHATTGAAGPPGTQRPGHLPPPDTRRGGHTSVTPDVPARHQHDRKRQHERPDGRRRVVGPVHEGRPACRDGHPACGVAALRHEHTGASGGQGGNHGGSRRARWDPPRSFPRADARTVRR